MNVPAKLDNHERRISELETELGGAGGGSINFPDSGQFPQTGEEGIIYIDMSAGVAYFWNGANYIPLDSFKQFPTVGAFPPTGHEGFIYFAADTGTAYYWNGSAYVPLINPAGFIQNQIAIAQVANFRISGRAVIGAGTDFGVDTLQVNGQLRASGVLSLGPVPNNIDPTTVVNGGMFYNLAADKVRMGRGGVWKNIALEESIGISGHIIYVDNNSVNATDTRTGLSNYSATYPFKTIQAAITVSENSGLWPTDVIYVRTGTYTENITCYSPTIVLGPAVLINGRINASQSLFLRGDVPINSKDVFGLNQYSEPLNQNISRIVSSDAAYTIGTGTAPSSVMPAYIEGIHIENNGTGDAIFSQRGLTINNSRAIANGAGMGVNSIARGANVNNCYVKSTGNNAISGADSVHNSTAISLGPAGTGKASTGGNATNSNLYSANDSATGLCFILRDCMVNSYESLYSFGHDDGTQYHIEMVNNIINIRNPAVTYIFQLTLNRNVPEPAVIMNNQFNKGSFQCNINAVTGPTPNIEVNNVYNLPFGPTTPRIGGVYSAILLETYPVVDDPLNP